MTLFLVSKGAKCMWNGIYFTIIVIQCGSSSTLADLYQANDKSLGVIFDPRVQQQTWGSPDMGDVSKIIP